MPKADTPQDDHQAVLDAEWERVTAEYETAKAIFDATPKGSEAREMARRRWEQAQRGMAEARAYWRSIGEAVAVTEPDHPGARASFVKVADNDGSAP